MDKFLVKYDFNRLINEENIDQITKDNDKLLFDKVDTAVEECASYIRHYYDAEKVFKVTKTFSEAGNYLIGDRVFWVEAAFNESATYTTDSRVSYDNNIYKANTPVSSGNPFNPSEWIFLAENNSFYSAIQDGTGNLPSDTASFLLGDTRNTKMIELVVDVALYHIHAKISPRNVPELRRVRYDGDGRKKDSENAIVYLEKIQRGKVTPDLPAIVPTEQKRQRIAYGVQSNLNYNY